MPTATGLAMTRAEFRRLSEQRLREARALLDSGQYAAAYYLAGCVVELGLKACICRRRMRQGNFPEKEFSRAVYTHNLEDLVSLANLKTERDQWTNAQPAFGQRWADVARWTENARYLVMISQADARRILTAIGAPRLGVLTWLRRYW